MAATRYAADTEHRLVTWFHVKRKKPSLTKAQRAPGAFGVPVLIHPAFQMDGAAPAHLVYYGCRVTDKPDFYVYGVTVPCVEFWMHIPDPPLELPR